MKEVGDRIEFRMLGELAADLDGRRLELGPRLQRQLLAILLSEHGRTIAVDRLIDLLWAEEPPSAAIASLQAYVSQLRRILEPDRPPRAPAQVLVTADPGYSLQVDPEHIDARRFERLAREGRAALDEGRPDRADELLGSALGLWRGAALAEFEHEVWAVPMVARLDETRDNALEDRIDSWLALGRHAAAASELEEMVQERPLRERRWAQLVLAHYRAGRQADALRAYQRCRTVLADELGIEPSPALRRLEAAVLGQDPSLDAPPLAPPSSPGDPVSVDPATAAPDPAIATEPVHNSLHERPLQVVAARITEVVNGRGGAVVLVGEPGAGKTTLAERAARMAADAGTNVVWTRCVDPDSSPAYWPWVQTLRQLPQAPPVDAALQRLEGHAETGGGQAAAFAAYESVVGALRTAVGTLLLVVDDLHAADRASLDLLELLAGDLHRLPLFIVATLRDTEPSEALDGTLGELVRHRGVERVSVPHLQPEEVAALTEQITRTRPDQAVVSALLARTGGNAFYLVELLRLLVAEHRRDQVTAEAVRAIDVPSGVRDVVRRRVSRLPDNTRTLLTVSAVVGIETNLDLLEHVAGLDSEQLMLALEPAVAAGLLAPVDAGWGYRFRHPLIQESLYAGTPRVERARLHARIASGLEALPDNDGPPRLADLAYHWAAAGPLGDPARAVEYLRRAATAAGRAGAWANALRLLEQALEVIDTTGRAQPEIRGDVLVDLGRIHHRAGSIPESHAVLYEAIRLADEHGDEDRVLAAALAFGAVSAWGSRDWGEVDHRLIGVLERQLRRLDEADIRRVRILATLGGEMSFGPDALRGWSHATEALELGRRSGDRESLDIVLSGYLMSALVNDRLAERAALMEELLAGDLPGGALGPDAEAVIRTNLLTERLRFGDPATFDAELPVVRELATDVLHSRVLQGQLLLVEACRALYVGDTAEAWRVAQEGFAVLDSPKWAEPAAFVIKTTALLVSHHLSDHAPELEGRLLDPGHPSVPHLAAPAAALGYALGSDSQRARDMAKQWFTPPPLAWTWMQAVTYWAQVAALTGTPDPEWCHDALVAHAGEIALVGAGADCGGAVDSLLAGLLLRMGRPAEALDRALAGQALEQRAGMIQWFERTAALVAAARAR